MGFCSTAAVIRSGAIRQSVRHRGGDPLRRDPAERQAEAGADAATHHVETVVAEMIHEGEMVGGETVPAILGGDAGARAAGIALIHRHDGEMRRQLDHRVHPGRRSIGVARTVPPEGELRAQPARREDQQRIAGAVDLVIDFRIGSGKYGHRTLQGLSFLVPGRRS
jgi:hypothetical protein